MSAEPQFVANPALVRRARSALHEHIRRTCGRKTMDYGELRDAIGWHGRGRALASILDAVLELDREAGLPGSTAVLVWRYPGIPATTSGWEPEDFAYHKRMIARCWMAFDA